MACGLIEVDYEKVTQALDYQPGKYPEIEGQLKRGVGFAATMQASGLAKIHLASVKI